MIEKEKQDLINAKRAYKSNHKWFLPEDPKDPRKPYTGAAELLRLARKTSDPLLPKIVEYKQLGKLKGTFIDGFAPSNIDKRVHTTFKLGPATGQLASCQPNIQNCLTHGELAKEWKSIEAAE